MSDMFYRAAAFNGNICGWPVSDVMSMDYMFREASKFNQYIGGWNVGKVVNMENMFDGATAFQQDISRWNLCNVNIFSGFLRKHKLATEHYSRLWIKWSKLPLQTCFTFHGGSSQCDLGLPAKQRQYLDDTLPWSISDGSPTGKYYIEHATRILVR